MIPLSSRTRAQNFFLILMLGALSTITPISIDLYLPAFPEIAKHLNTTVAKMSLSVSTYFLGYAIGQILYGPFLDRFGRKPPLFIGLGLYILSTVGCMVAPTIEVLLVLRFVQALGGSAASVASTAMVRDFFPVKEGAKIFSLMMLMLGVSPLLAPTLGGWVVTVWDWHAVFGILAGVTSIVFLLLFLFLPEGHPPDATISLNLKPILQHFGAILKNKQFFTYTLAGSFSFAGLFVYVAGSPSIFMDQFQVSAKMYGAIFALLSVGMIGGSQFNLLLGKKFQGKTIFKTALISQVTVGFLFLISVCLGFAGLYSTIGFLFVLLACCGLTYPNAAAFALAPFSKNVGSASSLLGFIQMGTGALLSSAVGLLEMKGTFPTAAVIAFSSAFGLMFLIQGERSSD